jgi:hypothetical protein
MPGTIRASLIFGAVAFLLSAGLAYFNLGWCMLPLTLVLALAGAYIGALWAKDDPSKTARNTRNGARTGLIVGVAGLVGRYLAGLVVPAVAMSVLDLCIVLIVVAGSAVLGGVGGWSWARHEHEVQTGYKPT